MCCCRLAVSASGKTFAACVLVIEQCAQTPGLKVIIGGINFKLLKRNVVPIFEKILSTPEGKWKHPAIVKGYSDNSPSIKFANGAEMIFVNLTDFLKNRGATCGYFLIEEPSLLPSASAFTELIGRVRQSGPFVRQIILCTNPETSRHGWIRKHFELDRFNNDDPDDWYRIGGDPCKCHVCTWCANAEFDPQDIPWGEDNKCSRCNATRDSWIYKNPETGKDERHYCPGNQQYTRVIKSKTVDNDTLPADYIQNLVGQLDEKRRKAFVDGRLDQEIRVGKAYEKFTDDNVLDDKHPLADLRDMDFDKGFIWGLDFNLHPQCSSISQIEDLDDDHSCLVIKDEIVLWDANAEDVANEFVRRYRDDYKGTVVYIHGDPSGFRGQTSRELTRYHLIMQKLIDEGFKVQLCVTDNTTPLKERIDNVNHLLKNGEGQCKLFVAPKCEHVIASFEGVDWDIAGRVLDASVDKAAKKEVDKSQVYVMTHPTDGVGYAIYKLFPILNQSKGYQFALMPDHMLLEQETGGPVKKSNPDQLKNDPDPKPPAIHPNSIGQSLRDIGFNLPTNRKTNDFFFF
jgi:hypothetical protein